MQLRITRIVVASSDSGPATANHFAGSPYRRQPYLRQLRECTSKTKTLLARARTISSSDTPGTSDPNDAKPSNSDGLLTSAFRADRGALNRVTSKERLQ